jgi:hypothetical protein
MPCDWPLISSRFVAQTGRVSRLVSAESRHHPEPDGSPRPERSFWGIAAVALAAGLLQIIASVALGLASLERFTAAADERPAIYMVVAVLIGAGSLSVWLTRERFAIAMTLAIVWPIGMWYALHQHTSWLGLAYHGEFMLHHLSAVLCLFVAVGVSFAWAFDKRLGKLRWLPAVFAVPGTLALVGSHLGRAPLGPMWLMDRSLATTGAALLLLAWPIATVVFWRQLGPRQRRPLAVLLLLPLVVKVAAAGWDGLSGELVPHERIVWIGGALVVTGISTLVLLRPRLEHWVLAVVGIICLLGSMFAYYLYEHGFGELEDGLGGLLQSLFGFVVPYPSYVDDTRSAALMMGLFFMCVTVYSALVSAEDRVRGIALGLMVIAGIGFSSPHLALMFGTGALLVIEGLLPGAPDRELDGSSGASGYLGYLSTSPSVNAPDQPTEPSDGQLARVHAVLDGLAERLGLDAPTLVATGANAASISLRGELDSSVLDVRARVEPGSTRIELSVGLPGRGEPVFELIPDPGKRGQRPAHLLARSHRVHGEMRAIEAFGDAPLDALTCFPTAYLRAWDGGVSVDLGRELVSLRVDHLESLVRSLARALDPA